MSLFYPLTLAISLKYGFRSKAHKFASFVAILSIIGIAIGVAALIVDTSIMQGLQNRLKKAVLKDTPHIVVNIDNNANTDTIGSIENKLLNLNHVVAVAPFVQGQTLLQGSRSLALINLEGIDTDKIKLKDGYPFENLGLVNIPEKGSFSLNAEAALYLKNNLHLNSKVRLISTINARYTPMGLTPTQRIFLLNQYYPSTTSTSLDTAVGNYDDVRRLFRMTDRTASLRVWLDDPFSLDEVRKNLDEDGFNYSDWTKVQGEFFKAVAMEKLTMGIMLCLIIVVAAFNILSALTMMVSARLTEISILKTLGLTNKKILSIFMMMGIFAGVIGTLIGIILGIPLTYYISSAMSNQGSFGNLPVSVEPFNLCLIGFGSILMSFIFTLYPAYRASATDPVENLCRG